MLSIYKLLRIIKKKLKFDDLKQIMEFLFPGKPKRASSSSLRYQIRDDEQYGPNSKLIYRGRIINRQNPFPTELFTFSHLQVLDLSSKGNEFSVCVLDSIPIELFRLRNLKVLNIDSHNIRKIPNEITSLTKLEVLSLNNNKLSKLPFSFSCMVTLKYLLISNNNLEIFPEVIYNFIYNNFNFHIILLI
jgi:hypothetical protein